MSPVVRSLALLATLAMGSTALAAPLRVFVSVPPMKTFVEKIGGNRVDVGTIVRPGHNPHTYEPTPRQIQGLSDAQLYFQTGGAFEQAWMTRIKAANPDMQFVDTRSYQDSIDLHPSNHDQAHGHAVDPHFWTSPPLVQQMAADIRDQLVRVDPRFSAEYERNYLAFREELENLDREIRALLAPLENRSFMVFHPSWGYFAATYDLIQISIEVEGKTPGARSLANLIEEARKVGISAIFVQPQTDRRMARQIARAIDAEVIAIDPLAPNYTHNMLSAAQQIAKTLKP